MTEQLEARVRHALAQHAGAVPLEASERLRRADYRPRTSRSQAMLTLGPLAGIAVAGAVIAVVGLGTATPRALAGWTASPTTPATGQAAAAEAACRSDLPSSSQLEKRREEATGPHPHIEEPAPRVSPNELPLVLTDTRGPYTYVILADSGERYACLIGPWPTSKPLSVGGSEDGAGPSPAPASGQVGNLSFGGDRLPNEEVVMSVTGRTGADVSAVALVLQNGTHVSTTVAHGWFLAWWPGAEPAVTAEIQTAGGSHTIDLKDPLIPQFGRRHSMRQSHTSRSVARS
jgi:hypothetical protein